MWDCMKVIIEEKPISDEKLFFQLMAKNYKVGCVNEIVAALEKTIPSTMD